MGSLTPAPAGFDSWERQKCANQLLCSLNAWIHQRLQETRSVVSRLQSECPIQQK